jgi:predicted RNase H-like nuclease (RuvC/YqgF family)
VDEMDAAEEIVNLLRQVKREVDRLKSRERVLEGRVDTMQVEHDGLVEDLARAHREVSALRINLNQTLGRVQRVEAEAGPSAPDLQTAMDSISFEVFDQQGTVQRLKTQMGELNDKFDSGGGVTCHGMSFGSQKEFVKWYKLKGISNHAMFMDAVAVLHSITDSVVSDEQYNKTRES